MMVLTFLHGVLRKTLAKYGVTHRVSSTHNPQPSGQVELTLLEKGLLVAHQFCYQWRTWVRHC
jgi:hypothetical protein